MFFSGQVDVNDYFLYVRWYVVQCFILGYFGIVNYNIDVVVFGFQGVCDFCRCFGVGYINGDNVVVQMVCYFLQIVFCLGYVKIYYFGIVLCYYVCDCFVDIL